MSGCEIRSKFQRYMIKLTHDLNLDPRTFFFCFLSLCMKAQYCHFIKKHKRARERGCHDLFRVTRAEKLKVLVSKRISLSEHTCEVERVV